MKQIKQVLIQGLKSIPIGVTIGVLVATAFNYLYHSNNFYPSSLDFTDHFSSVIAATTAAIILWALMGFLFGAASLIFKQGEWSITKQTITHFIAVFVCFTPLAILAGWFPLNAKWLISYTMIFVVIYIVIWLISMTIAKSRVKKINQIIQNRK